MCKALAALVVCAACVAASGCAQVTYQAHSEKPVLLGSHSSEEYAVIRHASDKGKGFWLFFWLLPVGEGRGKVLDKVSNSGEGMSNITLHESYDVVDFFVQNWSTFLFGFGGITNSFNVDYEADVIEKKRVL